MAFRRNRLRPAETLLGGKQLKSSSNMVTQEYGWIWSSAIIRPARGQVFNYAERAPARARDVCRSSLIRKSCSSNAEDYLRCITANYKQVIKRSPSVPDGRAQLTSASVNS